MSRSNRHLLLGEATTGLQLAAEAVHHCRPTPAVYQKVAKAQAVLLRIIEERAFFYGGKRGLGWLQEMASLVRHLPKPQE